MADISLRDVQSRQGAVFADVDNPSVSTVKFASDECPLLSLFEPQQERGGPVHFGSPVGEFQAASARCAVFDLPSRSSLAITGEDRAVFLHNFCTNNIKRLQPGQGVEAFITSARGRILDHVWVFATEQALWVDSQADHAAALVSHLDRYLITEDVQLMLRTADYREFLVTGPAAPDMLSEWLGTSEVPQSPGDHREYKTAACTVTVRRVDWLGLPGCLVWMSASDRVRIWNALTASGAVPGGELAFHALRIKAGWPIFGTDLSEADLAQEAGRTTRAISFEKGCYLGQEPIARIRALGHVNRHLCGLQGQSGWLPAVGARVLSADRQEIGHIRSFAALPGDNPPLALAMLRIPHTADGTAVFVEDRADVVPATVFHPVTLD